MSFAVLDEMLADMAAAPPTFQPTTFWQACIPRIEKELRSKGFETFRQHESAKKFYVPRYAKGGKLGALLAPTVGQLGRRLHRGGGLARLVRAHLDGSLEAFADYRVVAAADGSAPPHLLAVSESQEGSPDELFEFAGRRYSRSMLNYLRGLALLKRVVDTASIRTVLEIGGGYGTLGEILLSQEGIDFFYVDIDLPPVAAVATWYLQRSFGNDAVATYSATRGMSAIAIDELRRTHRAAVLCPWQLPSLTGTVDLFANFMSFQEMEPEIVRTYAAQVTRLGARYLLLRNSARGKPLASTHAIGVETPLCADDYPSLFPDYVRLAVDDAVFGHREGDFRSEVMVLERRRST